MSNNNNNNTANEANFQIITGTMYRNGKFPWGSPLPPPLPTPSATGDAVQVKNKPVLVLDLDNTLIFQYYLFNASEVDSHADEDEIVFRMFLRPHLKEFLTEVMQLFEVVFWTAAGPWYAAGLIDGIERHVLGLPRSIYHHEERKKRALFEKAQHNLQQANGKEPSVAIASTAATKSLPESGTTHVNFYCFCSDHTLVSLDSMKYLPLLGRPLHRTVIVDDYERSFPLAPRNAIKVPVFKCSMGYDFDGTDEKYSAKRSTWIPPSDYKSADGTTPQWPNLYEEGLYTYSVRSGWAKDVQANDTALLDLLPLLRALAATREDEDITRELDHWREPNYIQCDEFKETMNTSSKVRNWFLGTVTKTRQPNHIPPLQAHPENAKYEEKAQAAMDEILLKYTPLAAPPPPPTVDPPSPSTSPASSGKELKHNKAAKKPKAKQVKKKSK